MNLITLPRCRCHLARLGRMVLPILLLGAMVPHRAEAQLLGSLTVQVEGLRGQEGNLCVKLFNGSQGFPNDNDRAVTRECVPIASAPLDQPLTYRFDEVPAGSYAVALYHDRNGNQQLDRGVFGMPIEGFGFSNDAPAVTSAPDYEDAVFFLAGSTAIEIQLRYLQ